MPADKPHGTAEYQRILATGQADLISQYQQNHGGMEIRRIQALMLLASCLSPEGDLGRMLGYALALPGEPWLSRSTPITDTSFTGIKVWLESMWAGADLSPGERKLIDWQNSFKNMEAAVRQLKDIEEKMGTRLAAQIVQ
ncbi:MAG: DurN family substrate-assisted peptide maturase [Pseudonocardiaceae bacterium]